MRLATGVTLHVTNADNDFFHSYLAAFAEKPALRSFLKTGCSARTMPWPKDIRLVCALPQLPGVR